MNKRKRKTIYTYCLHPVEKYDERKILRKIHGQYMKEGKTADRKSIQETEYSKVS